MVLVMVKVLIAGAVLAMVLIENVLTLLLMIEQLECKPATAISKQQPHTVLGVAVERRPAIAMTGNHNYKMGHGLGVSARD